MGVMRPCKVCQRDFYQPQSHANVLTCSIMRQGKSFYNKGQFRQGLKPHNKGNLTTITALCQICKNEFISKPSAKRKVCSKDCVAKMRIGESNGNWKGGTTPINKKIRASTEYNNWRAHVFQRDDYTCQACGERGCVLNADHELPFSLYPDLRFEILNGRTFCEPCHKNTDTYLWKIKTVYNSFERIG